LPHFAHSERVRFSSAFSGTGDKPVDVSPAT
jgi:hypothetical protein